MNDNEAGFGRGVCWARLPRVGMVMAGIFVLAALGLGTVDQIEAAEGSYSTIPKIAPVLRNPSFECSEGYSPAQNSAGETVFVPNWWTLARAKGGPFTHSARIFFEQRADPSGGCDTERAHVERIEGRDSLYVAARDLETPPEPGKPFDVVVQQQVNVVPGGDYSLSGWLLSLCGGSAVPSDCPQGTYIVKALGLDPSGGSDPASDAIVWAENLDNFVTPQQKRVGWSNVRLAARAQATRMTVFARVESPFRWHGNHGFIDALSLVRAPFAWFEPLPAEVRNSKRLDLTWQALQTPDVTAIPGGKYELLVDIQVRLHPDGEWRDLAVGLKEARTLTYYAPCTGHTYEFRIRARAEQPDGSNGVWPNQRYPGVWSQPARVKFVQDAVRPAPHPGEMRIFIPELAHQVQC